MTAAFWEMSGKERGLLKQDPRGRGVIVSFIEEMHGTDESFVRWS